MILPMHQHQDYLHIICPKSYNAIIQSKFSTRKYLQIKKNECIKFLNFSTERKNIES